MGGMTRRYEKVCAGSYVTTIYEQRFRLEREGSRWVVYRLAECAGLLGREIVHVRMGDARTLYAAWVLADAIAVNSA